MWTSFEGKSEIKSNLKLIYDLLMIFFPSIAYFFQIMKMKQLKSSTGFSKYLCLFALIVNILKIFQLIGIQLYFPSLFQSILIIISQLYLIHVYIEYEEDFPITNEKTIKEYLTNWKETLNPKKLWNWEYEIEYYKFTFFLIFILSIICILIGKQHLKFYKILAKINISLETLIELPQIKRNFVTKNTKNLSCVMVLLWFIGDIFKTIINLIYNVPIQNIFGGIIINCEDIMLTFQVILYDENSFINRICKGRPRYINLDDVKYSNDSNRLDFDTDKN